MAEEYEDDFVNMEEISKENSVLKEKINSLEIMLKQERTKNRRKDPEEKKNEINLNLQPELNEIDYSTLELQDQIGNGGNGLVYKCKWFGCLVAVKRLFDPMMTEIIKAEFYNEVKIHALLRHPNIVPFVACCLKAPYLCIITEFMPRGSLYSLLHLSKAELSNEKKSELAKHCIFAVSYMHSLDIVHNDIKPHNVLLSETNSAKLCDFGQSRIGSDPVAGGTVSYCAPEIFINQQYGKASDIYSLGILIGEIFSRQVPFDGIEAGKIIESVKSGKRPEFGASIPSQWKKCITSCILQDPSQRPSASSLCKDCCSW